ncbi:MAG: DnaA/Hda family protein [Myxococcota bacterium]|nr:DnaA/Hda family protein [Myxococcota bacterium]
MQPPPTVWDGVLRRLHSEMPEYALDAWIRPLTPIQLPDELVLQSPSAFHQHRVETRFLGEIERALAAEIGHPLGVRLEVGAADAGQAAPSPDAPEEAPASTRPEPELPVPIQPDPAESTRNRGILRTQPAPVEQLPLLHTFESFVVGPNNALAREAALAVSQGMQPGATPLFLAGPSGTGKSHLARAIASEARQRGRTVYASAESFTSLLVQSIRTGKQTRFKQRFRDQCDFLVLEDVQFLEGKSSSQLELFHTIEHLRLVGRPVVLTGDRLPCEIPRLDARLSSEMASGLVALLEPPDAALRRGILRQKAASWGVRLPDAGLDLLVERVRGSARDLDGVLRQIVVSASLLGRRIDTALIEQALLKVAPSGSAGGGVSVTRVIDTVSAFFGLAPHLLASPARNHRVLLPRQIAMFLCHRYTDASYAEIGRALGREHPAVRNAIRKIDREIAERAPLRYQVEAIAERLQADGDPT